MHDAGAHERSQSSRHVSCRQASSRRRVPLHRHVCKIRIPCKSRLRPPCPAMQDMILAAYWRLVASFAVLVLAASVPLPAAAQSSNQTCANSQPLNTSSSTCNCNQVQLWITFAHMCAKMHVQPAATECQSCVCLPASIICVARAVLRWHGQTCAGVSLRCSSFYLGPRRGADLPRHDVPAAVPRVRRRAVLPQQRLLREAVQFGQLPVQLPARHQARARMKSTSILQLKVSFEGPVRTTASVAHHQHSHPPGSRMRARRRATLPARGLQPIAPHSCAQ